MEGKYLKVGNRQWIVRGAVGDGRWQEDRSRVGDRYV